MYKSPLPISEARIESQCKRLLAHLRRGERLTTAQVQKELHITSFHRRLTDLKRKWNVEIKKEWCNQNGVRFLKYYLKKQPNYEQKQLFP